jgi:hypothetical protein
VVEAAARHVDKDARLAVLRRCVAFSPVVAPSASGAVDAASSGTGGGGAGAWQGGAVGSAGLAQGLSPGGGSVAVQDVLATATQLIDDMEEQATVADRWIVWLLLGRSCFVTTRMGGGGGEWLCMYSTCTCPCGLAHDRLWVLFWSGTAGTATGPFLSSKCVVVDTGAYWHD